MAVCSKHSFIASKKNIKLEEIVKLPIVLREQGSGTLEALKESLRIHKIKLSDLDWDFSDSDVVELKIGNVILEIERRELDDFIESWDENFENEE